MTESTESPPLRVFLSHTSELSQHPANDSFIAAAERAVFRAGGAISNMAYFSPGEDPPAAYCRQRVEMADVYVGIIGFRYGSPVADKPDVSYTELEYDTATQRELPRLVFLLDENATLPLPRRYVVDPQYEDRQQAFRARLLMAKVIVERVASPNDLELRLFQALDELRRETEARIAVSLVRPAVRPSDLPREGRVFLCYRRDDTLHPAGRLFDRLESRFERVFMDIDNIEPGLDFTEVIKEAVGECHVFLVMIGPQWVDAEDESHHRRLDDPEDWVVQEIAEALKRRIRVIPVLIGGARMPLAPELPVVLHPLAHRQAFLIRNESFTSDAERLIGVIRRAIPTDS